MDARGGSRLSAWVGPVVFAVLGVFSLVLAYFYADSRPMLFLAEGLSLFGLSLGLPRVRKDLSGWFFLLASVAAALISSYGLLEFLNGKLELENAVQLISATLLALFTVALWRSTEGTKRVEELLVRLEREPVVSLHKIEFTEGLEVAGWKGEGLGVHKEPVECSRMKLVFTLSNLGRHALVVRSLAVYLTGSETLLGLAPKPLEASPVVQPGASAEFEAEASEPCKEIYAFYREMEECLPGHTRVSEAWGCVGLALEVVHGGSLGGADWLCFKLVLGPGTGGVYLAEGYQAECPQGVRVRLASAGRLV